VPIDIAIRRAYYYSIALYSERHGGPDGIDSQDQLFQLRRVHGADADRDLEARVSGAYPDGCTAADIPGCEPEPRYVDEDAAYDAFVEACDRGAACGFCHHTVPMQRFVVLGIGVWNCPHCGCESIDSRA